MANSGAVKAQAKSGSRSPQSQYRYVVGGQVCVDRDYRGRGLLAQQYRGMRDRLAPGHELCITEVSERNAVLLRAHLRMGFQRVGSYADSKDQWQVIAWELG